MFLTQRAAAAWLSIRLDFIGLLVLTCAGLLAVRGSIDPGLAGLSLTYALDLTKFLKFGTQMASKVESDFNSVERIYQYLEVRCCCCTLLLQSCCCCSLAAVLLLLMQQSCRYCSLAVPAAAAAAC